MDTHAAFKNWEAERTPTNLSRVFSARGDRHVLNIISELAPMPRGNETLG